MSNLLHVFSQADIDRAAPYRADSAGLAERRADPKTRCLLVRASEILVEGPENAPLLVSIDPRNAEIFLGLTEAGPLFARLAEDIPTCKEGARFEELRAVGTLLSPHQASEAAYAVALAVWHGRHKFCAACGNPTVIAEAGHKRICPACTAEHFPRTDPAIIVLVEHEGKCLLAVNARYPAGMRSILAGFVEPGENLEEAVAREIFEEVGVTVSDIVYQASQPWPFPSSLMLGFRAKTASAAVTVDGSEILEAAWYSRADITAGLADGSLLLPGPLSIARRLIEEWRAEA